VNTEVLYVTGAPATGKSTLLAGLLRERRDVVAFSYGEELTKLVQSRTGKTSFVQDELRAQSANLITPEDVAATDRRLAAVLAENRGRAHVVMDSHAVTKEGYGFRCTPFDARALAELGITKIACLYADAVTVRGRILSASGGRPLPTPFESDAHVFFQASVAITYGILLGCAVHFIDAAAPREDVLRRVGSLLPH
jgi:adenylate kinase